MSKLIENPFTNRKMITKKNEFVGREREIGNILPRLMNGNSVSIVGERRIGKSSLLYHIFLTGNIRLEDKKNTKYRFVYLDTLSPLFSTPRDFANEVLRSLEIEYDKEEVKEAPLKELTMKLRDFKETGTLPILLIDEFEELTNDKEVFSDDFFESLRSCCNSGYMTIVTVSRHPLKELTTKSGLTSPFWNIFSMVPLKEFTIDDKINEVADFLQHFWDALKPDEDEIKFLLTYPSTHPLILQVVSCHLFMNRQLGLDKKKLKKAIKEELSCYFRTGSEKIKRWLKYEGRIVERIEWTTEFIGKQVKNLGSILELLKPGP